MIATYQLITLHTQNKENNSTDKNLHIDNTEHIDGAFLRHYSFSRVIGGQKLIYT